MTCHPTRRIAAILLAGTLFHAQAAAAQDPAGPDAPPRDEFFWLGQMNKASLVINSQEGLLDPALAPDIADALTQVIAAGDAPDGERPRTVISFEPLLIDAGGPQVTLLHAGRSSQDMHATFRAAMLRDKMLELADQLHATTTTMVDLAERHAGTIVPNYTNGVAAQPNSLGHYLLGHAAGLDRDAQRIREAYARIDRSAMGTTVLNGTGWPLNRQRMAEYLGFPALVENTYVSSAMPQKRNPGLLNNTRSDASQAIALAMGPVLQTHNITPGMPDPKDVADNAAMVDAGIATLSRLDAVLQALVIDQDRALEELNSDWTASQEIADRLMRDHGLPFREGHHVASEIVTHARQNGMGPLDFPYAEAQRIYADAVAGTDAPADLPLTQEEFRQALDPAAIVAARATSGGPQPQEMTRMIGTARARLDDHAGWIAARRGHVDAALDRLDADFDSLTRD